MRLDLSRLRGPREHIQRTFEPTTFDPQDEEYRVVAPVELSMEVQKTRRDTYRATGHATTRLGMACGRCLEPFEIPVDAAFDLRYVPLAENTGEGEREVAEDDLATAYYREGELDVSEMLREQFQLALPMKPLCAEECRGLCPECGANLNRAACDCRPKWEDPRLAALRGVLTRDEENA